MCGVVYLLFAGRTRPARVTSSSVIMQLDADLDDVEPIDPNTITQTFRRRRLDGDHWIERLYGHHSRRHAFNWRFNREKPFFFFFFRLFLFFKKKSRKEEEEAPNLPTVRLTRFYY